jgi:predicted Zn-dependent protease
MPLELEDQKLLLRAHGYVELGMYSDAEEQLNEMSPESRHLPETLAVTSEIHRGRKDWAAMQTVVKQLAEHDPDNPQWPISQAYATRRAESIEAAVPILVEAIHKHPKEAILHYNLACYECQRGNMDAAREHLKKALKLEPKCRVMGLEDDDLHPLRDFLKNSVAE